MQATPRDKTPSCPECRADIDKRNHSHRVRIIESTVGNLHVRCRNAYLDDECHENEYCPQECPWTGPLSQWSLHATRECSVEVVQCPISCGHTCTRGQMSSHVGSTLCVEAAVKTRVAPLQSEIEGLKREVKERNDKVEQLAQARDKCREQNELMAEEIERLRLKHAKTKQSVSKITKLRKEKNELLLRVQALESRVKNEAERRMELEHENNTRENSKRRGRGERSSEKKRKRSGSHASGGRIRSVSTGNEVEVRVLFE